MLSKMIAFVALGLPLLGQAGVGLQDLSLAQVTSGLVHTGDAAVDGQGNVWFVQNQGLTRVDTGGFVTPLLVTGLTSPGELVRGLNGDIYLWDNVTPNSVALLQVGPAGGVTTLGAWSGLQASGIAQDAQGVFYMGTATGIYNVQPGAGQPALFANGIFNNGGDHLALDAQGRLFQGTSTQIAEITGPSTTSFVYVPPQPACPGCAVELPDFGPGYHGQVLTLYSFVTVFVTGGTRTTSVQSVRPGASPIGAANLLTGSPAFSPALAEGLQGDFYLLDQGTLFHLTGSPALFSALWTVFNTVSLRVDAPAGSPVTVAYDAPGLSFTFPGWGTFATSLGGLPSFGVVVDGIGAFLPPDPTAVANWASPFYSLPMPGIGLDITLQAYVLTPLAANGVLQISNALPLSL